MRVDPFKLSPLQRRLRYAGRKGVFLLVIACLVTGLILADRAGLFGRAPLPDVEKYHAKTFLVVHVVDGDTIDLDVPDGKHDRTRVRLWGVDTPETVKPNTPPQHFGREASDFTKGQTLHSMVRIELEPGKDPRDRFGRLLAWVYLPDGRLLNRVLVEGGYGYADPRYEHQRKAEFARLQNQAKDAGRGLWKDAKPDDLPYYLRGRIRLPARPE